MSTTFKSAFRKDFNSPEREHHLNIHDYLADCELAAIERGKIEASGNGHQSQRVICWCAEGIINGKRVAVHRPEDCEYVAARSALVETAWQLALKKAGKATEGDIRSGHRLNAEFVRQMSRLAAPLLNGGSNGNGATKPHGEAQSIGTATPTEAAWNWW
jgi:hypothetical protein